MEHTINDAIAAALRTTRRSWGNTEIVRSENTGMVKGSTKRPDILVLEPNVSPVVIEVEVMPATNVEVEALSRLGHQLSSSGRTILSAIAMRVPDILRSKSGKALATAIADADDLEFALFTGSEGGTAKRWPLSGWLAGNIAELSLLAQAASVPPDVIDQAANYLVAGVSEAAGLLSDMNIVKPGAIHKISEHLKQEDGEQTRRMAATILANAFVFQETLAGGSGELASVRTLDELKSAGSLTKSIILDEWRSILKVNYWPIFDIARRILEVIPTADSKPLIALLADTAEKLLENRLMRSHDLTGAVFQRLIIDRKFLAAYYTTPASASLLVGLAIDSLPLSPKEWADSKKVTDLRIADFACGTGTLLSTAYQRVGQLHELAGGDSEAIHADMMAHGIIGCDVLPAAAHLTASMLSGAHPTKKYDQSSIMTVAYGKQPDGSIALGSLDLLDPQRKFEILTITAKSIEGMGTKEKEIWESLPHASFDVVIMNPPFTRPTGHESKKIGVPNPMFAAFAATDAEQREMGQVTNRLIQGTSAHGNAGEASIFLVLADRKLKVGGTVGLVMPLSIMLGDAWEKSRELITKRFENLIAISISGADGGELSFSADTDMAECLLIAQKTNKVSKRATFVVLNSRPESGILGAATAQQIRKMVRQKSLRNLEDGPVGGTPISFGADIIGHAVEAPISGGDPWNLARISDISLAQTAYQLTTSGTLWLPTVSKKVASHIDITEISKIGKIGPYHADINGKTSTGGIRGPFDVRDAKPGKASTYPILWAHDADRERKMVFEADSEGVPYKGKNKSETAIIEEKTEQVWATASHCHFNRDFRFNSQSTALQFTKKMTIGGRAWLSIKCKSEAQEMALTLWGNTTLGILLYWWHCNKQQAGRGSIAKLLLDSLSILDVRKLSSAQIGQTKKIFKATASLDLRPIHEIAVDENRRKLDNEFLGQVLGLPKLLLRDAGPMQLIREKLSQEPSIRGHKND